MSLVPKLLLVHALFKEMFIWVSIQQWKSASMAKRDGISSYKRNNTLLICSSQQNAIHPCKRQELCEPEWSTNHWKYTCTIHYLWLYRHNKITEYSIIGVSTTSGSCCRSATSITAGGFPSSYSWLYMETNSARPISRKDGGVILSKDGWHDISNQTMLWQTEQHVKKVNRHN